MEIRLLYFFRFNCVFHLRFKTKSTEFETSGSGFVHAATDLGMIQNASTVSSSEAASSNDDVDAASFEVMSRQATINIGTIGHVAHGKSTVVKAMSGVRTTKFRKEAMMNITIQLGYANAKIFKCEQCEAPKCYQAFGSAQGNDVPCQHCGNPLKLVRHVSFVDCPGHDVLMATMLNGAAIMDAALLLIAANESFPQPQTLEHLSAVEILQLKSLIVLQNKIDLVKPVEAIDQYQSIVQFLTSSTIFASNVTPVIPISAVSRCNIDVVLQYIIALPIPERPLRVPFRFLVVRSFDVNAPGSGVDDLQGGVMGGSIQQGVVRIGDEIEIRPGLLRCTADNNVLWSPLRTRVTSIRTEGASLPLAVPGGLVAVGTELDPSLTRQNRQCGAICGPPSTLPDVFIEIEVQIFLLTHVVGMPRSSSGPASSSSSSGSGGVQVSMSSRFLPGAFLQHRVAKLSVGENLRITCRAYTTAATVLARRGELAKLRLSIPLCCCVDDKITISRMVEKKHRLIGWGTVRRGVSATLDAVQLPLKTLSG
jgi:translation initiation factor 2 subunit 3